MPLVAILVIAGLGLLGYGFVRNAPAALVVGGILLADAVLFYIVFGPASVAIRSLLRLGG